jgi:hypothetical protein
MTAITKEDPNAAKQKDNEDETYTQSLNTRMMQLEESVAELKSKLSTSKSEPEM